ncbi:succinate dehydrogenase cytochrome b subunit [Puteibacter caeruleilacunae]|nr:succinate dehydrogenase cytochrome b subunit [Puteibacter caeruleilacunae]
MSNFITASIGKKFMMSVTGLFLMMFVLVHLSLNLMLIFDDSGDLFNMAAHFMATNPAIRIMEPVLALGFIVHIIWSLIITLQNMKARPVKFAKRDQKNASSWASRNMLILGSLILVFLVVHIMNFFWKMKVSGDPLLTHVHVMQGGTEVAMENAYALVASLFKGSMCYGVLYILGSVLLGLHMTHGFWSAFQTIGFNNTVWRKRLERIATCFAVIVAVGYSIIPLYFMLKF